LLKEKRREEEEGRGEEFAQAIREERSFLKPQAIEEGC
jgi:hypothetical protein